MAEKVEISKRLVLINSTSSVLARLINIGVLVWLHQYLIRRIDPDAYSLYWLIVYVVAFVPLLTTILTSGLGRYIVEACARDDETAVTQIVSSMLPLLMLCSAALLVIGGLFAWHVDYFLNIPPDLLGDARLMLGLLILLTAIRMPMTLFGVGLYVRQRFVLSNTIILVRELVRLGILCALLFGVSTRVAWVVVATVAASLGEMIALQIISMRLIPSLRFRWHAMRIATAKKLTSFGTWQFVAQLANTIRTSADPIILNKLAGSIDVGVFSIGAMPLTQIQQGSFVASAPLQPALTAMHATGSNTGLRSAYLRGGRIALWASMIMVMPLVIFRNELFQLYLGEKAHEYAGVATVMVLLLAVFPIAYGNVMMPKIAHATAQMRPLAIRALITQVLNLALTFYLVGVREMGAVGSALSTFLVITFVYPLISWPLGWKMAGVDWRDWVRVTVLPGLIPAFGAMFVWQAALVLIRPDSWGGLTACVFVGVVAYGVVILLFCLQPADRSDLSAVLAKLRQKHRS